MSEDAIKAMSRANDKRKTAGDSLDTLGKQADSMTPILQMFGLAAFFAVDDALIVEEFPELSKRHDGQAGTINEYANPQAARVHFARVMWLHGYRPGGNHTWMKAGFAAVMEPN